jgi:glycosyltransferase involved in cell wall biosynthesis
MQSVESQEGFARFEYILLDDHSSDKTFQAMARFKAKHQNVKLIRNVRNLGLASSSNVALKEARGKFIMRLDADDYFVHKTSLREMLGEINQRPLDAIYPANYFGSMTRIQQPEENHHIGGAIFRAAALNHVKFTEGIRGLEGLDLYARARDQLKIGYFSRPIFFYRQHEGSLSKTNLDERAKIKTRIEEQYGGGTKVAGDRHSEAVLG